jgi:hypothetical protein
MKTFGTGHSSTKGGWNGRSYRRNTVTFLLYIDVYNIKKNKSQRYVSREIWTLGISCGKAVPTGAPGAEKCIFSPPPPVGPGHTTGWKLKLKSWQCRHLDLFDSLHLDQSCSFEISQELIHSTTFYICPGHSFAIILSFQDHSFIHII